MAPSQPTAQQLTQRLIDRELVAGGTGTTKATAATRAVEASYQALSKWIGSDGGHALFSRARTQIQSEHPSLVNLLFRARANPYMEGMPGIIAEHGATAVGDALESMLAAVVELLGRLIGLDMATNLIERSLAESAPDTGDLDKRRAEA